MGLVYATAPRGADHNKNDAFQVDSGTGHPDLELEITDRWADDKAAGVAKGQNFRTLTDSLGICHFAQIPFNLLLDMINASCGWNTTMEELLKAGERTFQLQRALSCKLGITAKDDVLPELAMRPIPDSGQEGHVPNMEKMLSEYYAIRDWNKTTGKPSKKRLESLGMPEISASIKAE
jgi:aldehyde:ferredoxin oxidoreductase